MARRKRDVVETNGHSCKSLGPRIEGEILDVLRARRKGQHKRKAVGQISAIIAKYGCSSPGNPLLYKPRACAVTIHLPDGQWHDINVSA